MKMRRQLLPYHVVTVVIAKEARERHESIGQECVYNRNFLLKLNNNPASMKKHTEGLSNQKIMLDWNTRIGLGLCI